MSTFERLYEDGKLTEKIHSIEKHTSIERLHKAALYDECFCNDPEDDKTFMDEIHETIISNMSEDTKLVYRDPQLNPDLLDEKTAIGKKYKKAKELCKDTQVLKVLNEKSSSKKTKKPTKRNHS